MGLFFSVIYSYFILKEILLHLWSQQKSNRTGLYKCSEWSFQESYKNISKKTIVIAHVSGQKYKKILSIYHFVMWNTFLMKNCFWNVLSTTGDGSIKWHYHMCIHVHSLKTGSTELILFSASAFWHSNKDTKCIVGTIHLQEKKNPECHASMWNLKSFLFVSVPCLDL